VTDGSGGGVTITGGAAGGGGSAAGVDGAITIGSTDTSAVTILGGSNAGTLTLGNASAGAVTLDTAAGVSIDAATASNFTVTGGTADLTLGARAATITLNESGDTSLDGTFTATSIIGALNELKTAGVAEASQVVTTVLATTGLTVGRAVYVSAADVASHTDANATSTAEVVGFVKTVGAAGTGEVVTAGVVNVAIEAGLTFSAGAVLYLGVGGTAGQLTDVPPSGSGDTIYEVGIANEAAAGSSADDQIEMIIRLGQRVVV
jgi:hypothetical protein